jgi:hypothetical protein
MGFFLRRKQIIEMQEELTKFTIQQMGFGPVGEIRMITGGTGNAHTYFRDKVYEANLHTYVSQAEAAMVTQRNDVMLVTPASHAWRGDSHATAAALTWDKTNCHILGMDPAPMAGYSRSRFSHAGYTMANFMTVSGDCNKFKNLRWMHGASTGGASDVTLMTISGHGNVFENIGFAGPNDATQAASANYKSIVITGSQNHFKNCIFGSVNDVDRSAANTILSFGAACGAWNIFENCVFRSRSGGGQATAYFINDAVTDTVVDYTAIFLNCQFIHAGTALTLAIAKGANTSRWLYFDNRCSFSNVTDVVADARNGEVYWGGGGASPDGSALNDKLYLGIAQTPIHTA